MASEEFYKIMADLREREKRLNDDLAALEDESRAYIRDHRELLVAIENDQGPTRAPQHPVAEALNTFHSLQVVGAPVVASTTETQPANDEDSLFIPEDAETSFSISENAEESLVIPEDAEKSLSVPEDAGESLFVPEIGEGIDEPIGNAPPRPKRRVTFCDAPATIFGAMSPSENLEFGNPSKTDESFPFQSPSNDANIDYDQPVYTGKRRPSKRPRHSIRTSALKSCPDFAPISPEDGGVNATQESVPPPVTSDDTNMGFDQPVYTGNKRSSKRARHFSRIPKLMPCPAFTSIGSDNGHVDTAQESFTLPVTFDDTIMGFDQPIYTGNRRPSKRARHFSRTPTLMLNTGFTPTLPDNKPDTYPQDFVGSYNPQDFVNSYDPRIPAGGPIEPWQSEDYVDITTESRLPDHVDSHFVCPYPDCGELYVNSVGVEQHLEHDHPDWALIKDTAIASDSM